METEFLYRFPGSTESEVGETRSDSPFYDSKFDYNSWLTHHRQKRMVRDKRAVYKSVSAIFSRYAFLLGLFHYYVKLKIRDIKLCKYIYRYQPVP